MRMIPGKTKVKIELFRGVRIADAVISAVFLGLIVLVVSSNLPGAWYIALGLLLLAVALLVRIDAEPNYIYLLHILRHLGYKRHYAKPYSDQMLLASYDEEYFKELAVNKLFQEEEKEEYLSKKERRALEKERSGKRKDEEKILKDKDVSDEEKQAILDRRAEEYTAQAKAEAAEREKHMDRDEMAGIMPFTEIDDDMICYGGEYYGAVLEISPVEFRIYSEYRRTNAIEDGLGRVLRSLSEDYAANIVKIDRPINYTAYREAEKKKMEELRSSFEQGFMSEEEFKARVEIQFNRMQELESLCTTDKVLSPFYYLVLFETDKQQLSLQINSARETLANTDLPVHRLNSRELALFLKYTNQIDFEEEEVDHLSHQDYVQWAMPATVDIKSRTVEVNRIVSHNFVVNSYPTVVGDSWLASVMSIPNTKVVIKCRPMDRMKAVRNIDRSLQELRGQYTSTGVDSRRVSLAEHIDTLSHLLSMLQNASETLLETNIYVTAYDIAATRNDPNIVQPDETLRRSISNFKQTVRRYYREAELNLNGMDFNQMNAFVGSQISAYDPLAEDGQAIPSNSLAACYPWIFANVSDVGGVKMGEFEGVPVFVDFFRRDTERVNSNMVIVGKSGSGKSYATKALLANLAAEDAKIFVLDPENEYTELAENLHGKFINVGNAQQGRLNPFHIITALEDDEAEGTISGSYATHLQFLEEFFRQILPDCDRDALEYLNSMIDRLYANMGITPQTDLSQLRPEDYPTFDHLYESILSSYQTTNNDYVRGMLRTLMTYVSKFAADGRNANIWNGPSTVTTAENFTVFNFQSLLANRNSTVANAQMLLVLKYIDNEIIKNREYNEKYGLNRKIVVVIDEAHVFIDTKYPVALDFMYQLAKRIRKYNGMQIVITQNIKDFVGSEEIARKSSAIINACQYSFIFALAPNDMQDLCKLYEKAGGINSVEQEKISAAPRGQAFAVMSPQSRSTVEIMVPMGTVKLFQERNCVSDYFDGAQGEQDWENFVGQSRERHDESVQAKRMDQETQHLLEESRSYVEFVQITEEELQQLQQTYLARRAGIEIAPAKSKAQEEKPAKEPEEAAAPVKSAPPQPVQAATSNDGGNSVEQVLAQVLEKFSYQSMMEEVRRSVREEMAAMSPQAAAQVSVTDPSYISALSASLAAALAGVGMTGTPSLSRKKVPVVSEDDDEDEDFDDDEEEEDEDLDDEEDEDEDDDEDDEEYEDDEDEDEDEDDGEFSALFETLNRDSSLSSSRRDAAYDDDDDEDDEDDEDEDDDAPFAFASIFNEAAMKEAARLDAEERAESGDEDDDEESYGGDDDDDDDDDSGFDIMALLQKEVEKMKEDSPIDMMSVYGEDVIEISLEELIQHNSKH